MAESSKRPNSDRQLPPKPQYVPPGGILRFRCSLKNTILDVLGSRGWKETDSDTDWDFNWAEKEWIRDFFDVMRFEEHQRINHFRNFYELTRKDLLVKNLKRMKKQLEKEDRVSEAAKYDFFPTTFVLPVVFTSEDSNTIFFFDVATAEYNMFYEHFKISPDTVWIMKPIGKSQGKGIFLFDKLNQISDWKRDHRWKAETPQAEAYIVQRYIGNPCLVGGKKFDLRIYVLVTSYTPLTVYLYRTGFARFSNHRFSMENIEDNYIHLTNVAIQKTAANYDSKTGCKWSLRNLKLYLIAKYGEEVVNELFNNMTQVILMALLSVQKAMIQDKHCFELYGYDMMIDDNLKPWLLEVNASPSLSSENPADYWMKFALLEDTLAVVDMERRLQATELHVGGFDLIYNNGPVIVQPIHGNLHTYLGCINERLRYLPKGYTKVPIQYQSGLAK